MTGAINRLHAVRNAVAADGVPAELIAVEGRGRRDPAVETADCVREVRNRRVRIVLYGPGA
jgi:outer membrane protein OmpA-like peptidoglycan-associated protein